ncbi:MAG: VTC domain-containing protein, partial [Clostridiales bacterium]|nr:VTC domain-containing protein [Clostridiales bacterium]
MSNVFKRNEVKYLLTKEQRLNLENSLKRHMRPDEYGEYFVQNLYFDNDSWDVIRASLDKPFYKEKLRLRCYGLAARGAGCFLELKKKCGGVVYKRRADIPAERFAGRSVREAISRIDSQIARELSFYLQSNPVTERIYIGYNRT